MSARIKIGLTPPGAAGRIERLLAALAGAYPVSFEERGRGEWRDLAAVIDLEGTELETRLPTLAIVPGEPVRADAVEFADDPGLDRRLRGQVLELPPLSPTAVLTSDERGTVYASAAGRAIWARDAVGHVVAGPLEELREGETLRGRLRPESCFPLLALVQFLREVTKELSFSPPPLRASFIIDDPNLRFGSYGYISSFEELVRHALTEGYHATIGLMAIDARLHGTEPVATFASSPQAVSLTMHGNDHVKRELERSWPNEHRLSLLAQALRRIEAFESSTGLQVARVMVPPHGVCSKEAMSDMLRLGFDAASISRPYPWRDGPPPDRQLARWFPAELVAGGLPVLERYHLRNPRADLVLRAFLDQPLLLYGHHEDLRDGFGRLGEAAEFVNALGSVDWQPLGRIARTNFASRREGESLLLRPYARRLSVDVPDGVAELIVEPPDAHPATRWKAVRFEGKETPPGAPIPVQARQAELTLVPQDEVDPRTVPPLPRRPWPYLRRAATELRDRLQPFVGRDAS